jgi:hypothetical protein
VTADTPHATETYRHRNECFFFVWLLFCIQYNHVIHNSNNSYRIMPLKCFEGCCRTIEECLLPMIHIENYTFENLFCVIRNFFHTIIEKVP